MQPLLFEDIRNKSKWVCAQAQSVQIHADKIANFASLISLEPSAPWFESIKPTSDAQNFENELRFLLMLDITNFCTWPSPRWRMEQNGKELGGTVSLTECYKQAIAIDPSLLCPSKWKELDLPTYLHITSVPSGINIPLAEERMVSLQQIGLLLANKYEGSVINFVKQNNNDASDILKELVLNVPYINDVHEYLGQSIPFYKRAQLIVADISSSKNKFEGSPLKNTDYVTACPDYKLPQILRYYGVISYSQTLAAKIDNAQEIAAGSHEEIEIRAATIQAIELLHAYIKREKKQLITSNQLGGQIWVLSQNKIKDIQPHHRTKTTYY